MTIPLGRRRLIFSFAIAPSRPKQLDLPASVGATDAELAKLNRRQDAAAAREAMALIYGGMR